MSEAQAQFREAMCAAGLNPPDAIEPGKLHRFSTNGKADDTGGWCKMFGDGTGGVFGDWRGVELQTWQARRDRPFSPAEREALAQRYEQERKEREAAKTREHAEAAKRAAAIWKEAKPAPADHPYLTRKGIEAHGARIHDGRLVLPMRGASGALHSLQFIGADGSKQFMPGGKVKGGYFGIGDTKGAAALCVAEGFATGASIHEATGHPVVVGFSAGNLEPVAKAMRERFADLPLILCADDDVQTIGNPGLTKATEAALSVGGLLAVPDFGTDRPAGVKDFNDLAALHGKEAVKQAIASASAPARAEHQPSGGDVEAGAPDGWPEPQALAVKVEPQPYPLDALPDTIRAAVQEVAGFVKAPLPLVASSALAALSLAIQAHADVRRADKLTGPTSLFLLTIADSGERKSTCDGFFTKAIRDYEQAQAEAAKPAIKDFEAAKGGWAARQAGVREKIKSLAKAEKPTSALERVLRDLEDGKPEEPRVPRLLYADATPEALAFGLAKHWPSAGVVSAEGGIVFGSHGMGKDSVMRNLSMLNQLWDGNPLTIDRRTSESFTVRGARLTMALQVQGPTLREFFERSGTLARGTGFLARFLVAWPESTQGFRPFTEAPANWPHLAAFNRRIAAILDQPAPIDDDGTLTPAMLPLTADAKAAWVAFHDAIEGELASGGELFDVRDVASKSADNAARLAALFHVFGSTNSNNSSSNVTIAQIEAAYPIAAWHLNEARRFFGELALPAELADAARLDAWLVDYCRRERTHLVGKNHTRQHGPLRDGAALNAAIRELSDLDRLRLVKDVKRLTIQVNPALLIDGGAL